MAPQNALYEVGTLQLYAQQKALEYGISYDELAGTISCESGWDYDVVGDGGSSRGIAQIHAPSHPTITDEQALDPYWAIDWMAAHFSQGNQTMWTCWRILYG